MLKFYEVQRLVDAFTREMGMFPRDAVITGETLKLHTGALTEVGFVELLIPNALFKRLSGRGEKGDLSEPFKYSEELTLIAFGENEPHRLIAYIGYVQHHFEKREGGDVGIVALRCLRVFGTGVLTPGGCTAMIAQASKGS